MGGDHLAKLGHHISIANSRGPESLAALAAEIGATPVSVVDAAKAGEIVILAIPTKAVADLPQGVFANVSNSVVVIDIGNYHPELRDGRIDAIDCIRLCLTVAPSRCLQWTDWQLGRLQRIRNLLQQNRCEASYGVGVSLEREIDWRKQALSHTLRDGMHKVCIRFVLQQLISTRGLPNTAQVV